MSKSHLSSVTGTWTPLVPNTSTIHFQDLINAKKQNLTCFTHIRGHWIFLPSFYCVMSHRDVSRWQMLIHQRNNYNIRSLTTTKKKKISRHIKKYIYIYIYMFSSFALIIKNKIPNQQLINRVSIISKQTYAYIYIYIFMLERGFFLIDNNINLACSNALCPSVMRLWNRRRYKPAHRKHKAYTSPAN